MKHKFWIDCPLCSVKMTQRGSNKYGIWYFFCSLCDTVTEIPASTAMTQKAINRREMLEKRRIEK